MICIFLSTYNGERFLAEQLQSLFDQSYTQWKLLVRDDGSTDNTRKLLEKFVAQDERIQILESQNNLGPSDSFMSLLAAAGEADFYAFCDQDDVWDKDKLLRSQQGIAGYGKQPALYCSRLRRVDNKLKPLSFSCRYDREPSFANALVQNIAIGCTIMFNRAAFCLLRSRLPEPGHIFMHDWWCYQLIAAFGSVVYDSQPTMAYRQHAANAVGETSGLALWFKRYLLFQKHSGQNYRIRHLLEFKRCWGDRLPAWHRSLLNCLLELMTEKQLLRRFALLAKMPIQRQSGVDSLVCRILLLFRSFR